MPVKECVLCPVTVGYEYTAESEADDGLRLTVNGEEMHYAYEDNWLMFNAARNIAAFAQRKCVESIALRIRTQVMGVDIGLKYLEFKENKLVEVVYLEEGTWKPVMVMHYGNDDDIISIGGFERKIVQSTEMSVPLLFQPGITIDVSADPYEEYHPEVVTIDDPEGIDRVFK